LRIRARALAGASLVALCVPPWACGDLPPAAEPAVAPPTHRVPAGRLFRVGERPEGITVDPATGLIAVALHGSSGLALVRADTGRVVRRIPVPATSRHISLARPGGPVLAPAEAADRLLRISLPEGKVTEVPVGGHPHDAAALGRRDFVSDEFGDAVSVVRGDRAVRSLPAPRQPGGIAASGHRVALVAVRQRVLRVYDSRTLRSTGEVSAGRGPTHVAVADRRAFVADTDGGRILVLRLEGAPRRVASAPAAGAPYGIALDRRRRILWTTLTARNEAVAYSVRARRPRRLATYPTLRQPNSIAVDPRDGAAWVTGTDGDRIERLPGPAQGGGGG
jgi:DNA-binding beta-propeller fold protein YncE